MGDKLIQVKLENIPISKTIYSKILDYSQEESFPSYDWFVATIFLIYRGDKVSTMKFLYNFHFLEMSSLIWPARLYSNDTLISNVYSIQGNKIPQNKNQFRLNK